MVESFRNADLQDLNELCSISRTTYLDAFINMLNSDDVRKYVNAKYSVDNLKNELEDRLNHFLFLDVDKKAAGYMKYSLKQDSLEIDRLYLLKRFKGMGIGSRFIRKAEDIAKENEKKKLTLGVLEMNKPAISFYEKRGFTHYSDDQVTVGEQKYRLLLMNKLLH